MKEEFNETVIANEEELTVFQESLLLRVETQKLTTITIVGNKALWELLKMVESALCKLSNQSPLSRLEMLLTLIVEIDPLGYRIDLGAKTYLSMLAVYGLEKINFVEADGGIN